MKYIFELNSRTSLSESVEAKHRRVVEALNTINKPWGLSDADIPFPGFGNEFVAIIPIDYLMTQGIKFTMFYRYRNLLDDHSLCDDRIYIEFSPKKIDLIEFTNSVIPSYIDFFNAYRAVLYNEKLMYVDFDKTRNINFRNTISRFYPTCFYDEILCNRALGINCSEIKQRLASNVDVKCMNGGAYFNNSEKFFTVEESNHFDELVRDDLGRI